MAAAFADQLATGAELYESDPDLIEPLVKKPEQTRIRVRRATTVTGVPRTATGLDVAVEEDGVSSTIGADLVVHGAGRIPDLDALVPPTRPSALTSAPCFDEIRSETTIQKTARVAISITARRRPITHASVYIPLPTSSTRVTRSTRKRRMPRIPRLPPNRKPRPLLTPTEGAPAGRPYTRFQ